MNLTDRMVAIHRLLVSENLPHAFGGALALGFCVESPRATVRRQVCWAWDCFWRRVAWAWRGPAFSRVVSVLVSGQRAFDVKRERTLPCLLG